MASRDRERSPRRDRRSGGGGNPRSDSKRAPPERRIFVSNIPYEMKWQEVKDMFRDEVGDVTYVQLFSDEDDKPRGCGILEFASEDLVRKAIEKMHRKELSGGRKLVVKEDFDIERDRYGRIIKGSGSGRDGRERGSGGGGGGGRDRGDRDRGRRDDRDSRGGGGSVMGGGVGGGMGGYGNTYGLSPEFLSSLGIDSPLHTRLFVANLVYSVDEKKLREVFRLAGRVISVELNKDKDGKSRGHGVIEYSHPVEAVQAISMFHDQALYDRKMIVRFDKTPGPTPEELDELPSRLPEGLSDVGMGLGAGGNPLTNVAANLPSVQQNANNSAPAAANNVNNVASIADLASNLQGVAALARQLNMNIGGGDIKYGLGAGAGMGAASAAMGMMGGAAGGAGGGMGGPMGASGGGAGLLGAMGGGAGGAASAAVGAMGNGVSMGGGIGGSGIGLGGAPAGGMGGGGGMSAGGGGGYGSGGAGGYSSGAGAGGMGGMGRGGAQSAAMAAGGGAGAGGAGGGGVRSSDTILVRNLPMECSWQSLREGFSHCGDIKYAEMKERGVGLIRFTSERDAERAITMMDKQNVNGRTIDVRLY